MMKKLLLGLTFSLLPLTQSMASIEIKVNNETNYDLAIHNPENKLHYGSAANTWALKNEPAGHYSIEVVNNKSCKKRWAEDIKDGDVYEVHLTKPCALSVKKK